MIKEHPKYKEVPKEEADGLAWAFDSKQSAPRQYYFKFPPLESQEVRIRVLYTSICLTDVNFVRRGPYGYQQPFIPGHQVVGRIQAVGKDAKSRHIGDIVGVGYKKGSCNSCKNCCKGNQQLCVTHPNTRTIFPDIGGFSTHLHVAEDWAFLIPVSIPLELAAPLLCAGITLYNPLSSYCKKGDKVGIVGIGGLGHLGLLLANKMGLQVTAFSSSNKKQNDALQLLGAHHYVVSTAQNLAKQKQKYDVVIITAPITDNFSQYFRLSKFGGKVCVPVVIGQVQLYFYQLTNAQRQYCGIQIGSKTQFHDMLQFCSHNQVRPICQQFDFMDFPNAFQKTQKGIARYRMVLKVNQNLMKKQ